MYGERSIASVKITGMKSQNFMLFFITNLKVHFKCIN